MKKLIRCLAPMEKVTDTVFRQVLCNIGKPDLFFTEFMNVDGYCSDGKEKVIQRISFEEIERPVIIQLWGNNPDNFSRVTEEIVKNLKPDGIDINMGCSVRDILKSGNGAFLITDKNLSKKIINGVKENVGNIPISVKTRIGYDKLDYSWIEFLLSMKVNMLTIHGRLAKENYSVPSRWSIFTKIKNLKDRISPNTLLIGNGDIDSNSHGETLAHKYDLDGFMVGRKILSNPWFFSDKKDISLDERLNALSLHLKIWERVYGTDIHFEAFKKYIKAYLNGFPLADNLRKDLMMSEDLNNLKLKIDNVRKKSM